MKFYALALRVLCLGSLVDFSAISTYLSMEQGSRCLQPDKFSGSTSEFQNFVSKGDADFQTNRKHRCENCLGRCILQASLLKLRGGIDGKARALIKAFKLPLNVEKSIKNSNIRLSQMQKFPKDPKVAEEGCAELWRICTNAEKQDRIGKHKRGCHALISVLQVRSLC